MRRQVSLLMAVISTAIVASFVIPLMLLVRTLAEDRGMAVASEQANTVAVLVSMVTGPLGYKSLSIGAAVSAAIIAAALLWHTLRAAAPKYKR